MEQKKLGKTMILDVGCGYLSDHKRREGLGIDLHKGTCDVVADAHFLPLKNCAFHKAYMRNVLEHLNSPMIVLKEVHRVLKENGEVSITIPIYHHPCVDELRKLIFGFPFRLRDTVSRLIRWKKHRFEKGAWHTNKIQPIHILQIFQAKYIQKLQPKHSLSYGRKGKLLEKVGIKIYYPPDNYYMLVEKRKDRACGKS